MRKLRTSVSTPLSAACAQNWSDTWNCFNGVHGLRDVDRAVALLRRVIELRERRVVGTGVVPRIAALDGRAVEASMRVPPVGSTNRSSAPSVALIMPAPTSTTSVLATFGSDTGSLVVRVRTAGTPDARRGAHSSKSCRSSSGGPIGDGCPGSQVIPTMPRPLAQLTLAGLRRITRLVTLVTPTSRADTDVAQSRSSTAVGSGTSNAPRRESQWPRRSPRSGGRAPDAAVAITAAARPAQCADDRLQGYQPAIRQQQL